MRDFFDTSVLVPVFVTTHPHHEDSFRVFEAASKETSACGAHSLAEVYAVLTRLPLKPPISAESAATFTHEISQRLSIVTLGGDDYYETIDSAAKRGITGGRVYDALLLRCAESGDAETIYTWNVKHFQAISPGLAARIRTPELT